MEIKMRKTIKFTILVSLIFLMIPLFAQHGRGGQGEGVGQKGGNPEMRAIMKDAMLEEAGVPEAKRAEIRKKGHEIHKKMMDLNFKVGEIRLKIKAEYDKKNPSIKNLKEMNVQVAELRKEQFLLMGNFKIDTFASLTVEQRQKLLELMKEKRKEFMGRMKGKKGKGKRK
jgi:Spy/CpxP family protein refolding chaperone